jgi:transcriptional regulator with XRE-family HTH domain
MTPDFRTRRLPPPEFGPALAAGRAAAGLGVRAAARRCGVSPGYYSLLESGQRCPSVSVARALADGLHLEAAARDVVEAAGLPNAGRDSPQQVRARERAALAARLGVTVRTGSLGLRVQARRAGGASSAAAGR